MIVVVLFTNWATSLIMLTVVAGWVTFLRRRRGTVKDTAGPATAQEARAEASTAMGRTPGG
ncbi:hypothetical protein [Humibacillus xanthopallidus]|uniref:hypothetical protein n=1 Tax=Humibacillus xanthopallidus TaxID=412689 RepID=UPI00114DA6B8|nr:hypothetical protein [Humibacillus xanthopallidus]